VNSGAVAAYGLLPGGHAVLDNTVSGPNEPFPVNGIGKVGGKAGLGLTPYSMKFTGATTGADAPGLPINVTCGFPLVQKADGPAAKDGLTMTVVVGGFTPVTATAEEFTDPAPLLLAFSPGPVKLTSPFCGQELLASGPSSPPVQFPASLNSRNPNIVVGSLMGVGGSKVDVNRKSGVGGVVFDCGQLAPEATELLGNVHTWVFRAQLPFKLFN
jgi:hypothetical protein